MGSPSQVAAGGEATVREGADVRKPPSVAPILFLFAMSGATSLIYELLWRRMLLLVLGGSMWATAIVLSTFMAGLGFGAIVVGRMGDRFKNPLRWYGWAEMAIGGYALMFPFICRLLRVAHDAAFPMFEGKPLDFRVAALSVTFVVLLLPTLLMGGTFPLLVRQCAWQRRPVGRSVRDLYLFNTVGAVAGTTLAGLFLIRLLGVQATGIVTAVANLAIGAAAVRLARGWTVESSPAKPSQPVKRRKPATPPLVASDPGAGILSVARVRLVLIVFALSGLTALSYETLWARVMVFLLSNSTYAFAVMLSSFLCGLALGAWLARYVGERHAVAKAALLEGLIAISAVGTLAASQRLRGIQLFVFDILSISGYAGLLAAHYLLALLVLLPTATLFGMVFPLLVRACTRDENYTGREVGWAYGSNTFGAIVGPLAAILLLIPHWGLGGAIVATALLNLLLCVALLMIAPAMRRMPRTLWTLAAGVVAVAMVAFAPRSIEATRHSGWRIRTLQERLLYYKEEPSATVAVFELGDKFAKVLEIDGVGQVPTDADSIQAFHLLGHLPFLVRDDIREVLVTAFGGGITLGAILTHAVERVDAVEICPAVLPAARMFDEENHGALNDRRLHVILSDANSYVRATPKRYDAIISDATHPGAAESWVLYTQEFYRNCKERLRQNGVMCQWVPLHKLRSDDLRIILGTFRSVFPHATLWFARGYAVLLATEAPLSLDARRIQRALADPQIGPSLKSACLGTPFAVLKNLALTESAFAQLAEGVAPATEDRTPLEYSDWHACQGSTVRPNCDMIAAVSQGFVPVANFTRDDEAALAEVVAFRASYYQAAGLLSDDGPAAALPLFLAMAQHLPQDDDVRMYGAIIADWFRETVSAKPDAALPLDQVRALAAIFPNEITIQMNVGKGLIAWAKHRRDDVVLREALGMLKATADRFADRADIQMLAAQEFFAARRYAGTQILLERAVRLDPKNALAWNNLARCYWALGLRDLCRQAALQALSIQPDLASAQTTLRSLGQGP